MGTNWFTAVITLIGTLLGFGFSWLLLLVSHRQRIKEANLARLRERQADVVAVLYERFYEVETSWRRLQDVDLVPDSERKVIFEEMLESEKRLRDDFNKNRLWITDEALREEIDKIFHKLRDTKRNYKLSSLHGGPISPEDKDSAWRSVLDTVNEGIPRIRMRLEERFRAYLLIR